VLRVLDAAGHPVSPSSEKAVTAMRRTTVAARLKAIYGSVAQLDAFTGLMAEPHVPGTEFGPLQLAIWQRQFEHTRDGDRFFYGNDPALERIRRQYGIDYRTTLSDLISRNTDVPRATLPDNVFLVSRH
jgi:hypothetical protein